MNADLPEKTGWFFSIISVQRKHCICRSTIYLSILIVLSVYYFHPSLMLSKIILCFQIIYHLNLFIANAPVYRFNAVQLLLLMI